MQTGTLKNTAIHMYTRQTIYMVDTKILYIYYSESKRQHSRHLEITEYVSHSPSAATQAVHT